MSYAVVSIVSLIAAGLTLFTGFGLGTILLPAFAIFFPAEVAVAATALVHLANNVFKFALIGRWADWKVVLRFGPAAAIAAIGGALLLDALTGAEPILEWSAVGLDGRVTAVKLTIAILIALFTAVELAPRFKKLSFPLKWLPAGGALSGFFGGLSGHQGALRTAFLLRANLSKEQLVGTMAVCAIIVDVARFAIYGVTFLGENIEAMRERNGAGLVAAGSAAALVGSIAGALLVKKITIESLRYFIAGMLMLSAVALGSGVI